MNNNNSRYSSFSRRYFLLIVIKISVLSFLLIRLIQLQVFERGKYKRLSFTSRTGFRTINPERGTILDRHGVAMASSRYRWQVLYNLSSGKLPLNDMINKLSKLIKLDNDDITKIKRIARITPSNQPILIKNDLDEAAILRLNSYLIDLPGVSVEALISRYYEYKDATPLPIGHVAFPTSSDREKPSYQSPNILMGKTGLELIFDEALIGRMGYVRTEINSSGQELKVLDEVPPLKGQPLKTTLDFDLQNHVFNYMMKNELVGSCVVMDIDTGDILCMVSTPTIDPNLFITGIRTDYWDSLLKNPYTPLTNKSSNGLYSPGSTIKPILAMAALENDIVNKNTKVDCPGYFDFGNQRFHCWKKNGHGKGIDMNHAMAESCDVYFYKIAQDLGMNTMVHAASSFGLGRTYFPDVLSGEQAGVLPTPSWKFSTRNASWIEGETIISSIGQGYWLVNNMQLAIAISRLASGKRVMPNFIYSSNVREFESLNFKEENFEIVRNSLFNTVNSTYGTAKSASINSSFAMSGKTGTVQVKTITEQERLTGIRKNRDLPWALRDHALFIGFVPKTPKYGISVLLEHGGDAYNASIVARYVGTELKKIYEKNKQG